MESLDKILFRVFLILLTLWATWISVKIGVKPEEIGTAIKTFNANFGPGLPDANRKTFPTGEPVGQKTNGEK